MRKEKKGLIVSDKMQKSVVVNVESITTHPLYKKTIKRKKKFMAHDPKNEAKVGDVVKIRETKPLSKKKRWEIIEILGKSGRG